MKELLAFFKDIFMFSDENAKVKIGLCQFRQKEISQPVKKVDKLHRDIKLSDLMRRSA